MQGQVTFLNQNGLIPFGITKSKRQNVKKHVDLTEKVFTVFSKNVFLSTVAKINAQKEICVQIYADRQGVKKSSNRLVHWLHRFDAN